MRLIKQKSGAFSVYHPQFKQTMHPGHGPWQEATTLYAQGSGLPRLLKTSTPTSAKQEVVVFDIGLGAGANALAALDCHRQLAQQPSPSGKVRALRVVSFERDLSALHFALKHAQTLGYIEGWENPINQLLAHGQAELLYDNPSPQHPPTKALWELRHGECPARLKEEALRAQLVFFDPFSWEVNPEMWALEMFLALRRCAVLGEGMRLVTYSQATPVQAGLLAADFFVGLVHTHRGEVLGTCAASIQGLLHTPLEANWLQRWKKHKRPLPPNTPPQLWSKWRRAVLAHPQWEGAEIQPPTHKPLPGKPRAMPTRSNTASNPQGRLTQAKKSSHPKSPH